MDENRAGFGIGNTSGNRGEGKKNHAFAGLSPTQAMTAGSGVWTLDRDDSVIASTLSSGAAGLLGNFRRKWDDTEARIVHAEM